MFNFLRILTVVLIVLPVLSIAAEPIGLSEITYKAEKAVIIMQINWGRTWKCGQFENAQLEALSFTKSPVGGKDSVSLDIDTPSKLFVDNKYLPYVYVVTPGEYVLTAFDVKIAKSVSDVAHIKGEKESLIKDGNPVGGSFTVNTGEIVYIGHFGLDCGAEPFLWRNYIDGRDEFEKYVSTFREKYPFIKQVPLKYRLFSTQVLGRPYSLENDTVK